MLRLSRSCLFLLIVIFVPAMALAATKLAISPANPKQLKNSTFTFTATINGKVVDTAKWSSSNPAIATISGRTGSATATLLNPGTTTITAVHGGQTATTLLSVTTAAAPVFTNQPSNTYVGAIIDGGTGVKVQLLDNLSDPLPSQAVTVSIGTNPSGNGTLTGTLTQTTDATGIATFGDLRIDWLGQGYTLLASASLSSGPVSGASTPFDELRVGGVCLGPNPACSSGCPDSDGDGLNDAWELAGGIDMNGDGVIDAQHDFLLPGSDPYKPDVYVRYDYMLPDPTSIGGACQTVADCGGPANNMTCAANVCTNDAHDPDVLAPGWDQKLINAYADHGVNLHIVRGRALPHSKVVSWRTPVAACEGADVAPGMLGAYAVNYFDLKNDTLAQFSTPVQGGMKQTYHFSMFGHYSGCDYDPSGTHCAQCPASTKSGQPQPGQSGMAELPGNDSIVSLGHVLTDAHKFNNPSLIPQVLLGGTFMHELGHNFGLLHGGDDGVTFKPNFLSVLNYNYQFTGILVSDAPPVDAVAGPTPDPALTRLDYSNQRLKTLDEFFDGATHFGLDEASGLNCPCIAPYCSGLATSNDVVIYSNQGLTGSAYGSCSGAIDWDGNGDVTGTNLQVDLNASDHPALVPFYTQLSGGQQEWGSFQYGFQCTPNGSADGATLLDNFVLSELTPEAAAKAHVLIPPRKVDILIRPGCSNKAIAAGAKGVVIVALLGAKDLDVNEVETDSLNFHRAKAVQWTIRDVNGDGIPDLLAEFRTEDVFLSMHSKTGVLRGWMRDSQSFFGSDAVVIVSDPRMQACQ